MKKDLSTLEIRQLVNEFQSLLNGRIDKIYQLSKKEFLFKIRITGGNRFLKIRDKFIFLHPEKEETPAKPTTFCMVLRKHLEGRKVSKILQKGSERIIVIGINPFLLIMELYGQTNMVLCDENYSIIAVNRPSREIKKGEKYVFPEKRDIFWIKEKGFIETLNSSKQPLVKKLAALVGGIYSEEICFRAGIAKDRERLSEKEAKQVFNTFSSLLNEEPSPMTVYDEKPVDATVYDLKVYEGRNKVAFSAFYEAVDSYLTQTTEKAEESELARKYQGGIEKIEKIIATQKKNVDKLKKEMEQNQRAGEMIYERYQELAKLMKEFEEARKKMSWDEIKSRIKNKKIKSVEEKNQKIIVEL